MGSLCIWSSSNFAKKGVRGIQREQVFQSKKLAWKKVIKLCGSVFLMKLWKGGGLETWFSIEAFWSKSIPLLLYFKNMPSAPLEISVRERERGWKPERAAREALSGVEVLRLHHRHGRRRRRGRWKGWRGPLGSLAGKDLHSCTLSLLLQDLRAH